MILWAISIAMPPRPLDTIEQALESLLVVVHAEAKIGDDLERPALLGAIQLQHLLLALQIVLLVVAGDTVRRLDWAAA